MAAAILSPVTDACGGTSKSNQTRMESKPNRPAYEELRPFLTVSNQAEFAEALQRQRVALGLTLADLDHIAGFHEGYAAHLEKPFTRSGKKSFKITAMAEIWLEALGLTIALIPKPCASSALGETPSPGIVMDKEAPRLPVQQIRNLTDA